MNSHVIYSDETYLWGKVAFAFGALICTPRRVEILREQLSEIRQTFDYRGELKWKKVSRWNLPICERFIDLFLNDRHVRFSVMKVVKGQEWCFWGRSEEERFFKSYYVFLKLNANPYSRCYIYPDNKCLQKNYRWNTLRFAINRSRSEWAGNIKELYPLDSKREDLLQLTDLLLGCLTSNSLSDEKDRLRNHVLKYLAAHKPQEKFRITDWSPQPRKN
jgi:hypothetical protein